MDNRIEEVSGILVEWRSVKERLEVIFRERDQKSASEMMKKGIDLFIRFLFLSNEKLLPNQESIPFNLVDVKPVNVEERLEFIIARPNLYHSYRQLSELMVEQEKLFAKKNIVKKASKPKG